MDTLYYIGDPMCSWCWGFAPALETIEAQLPETIACRYVMGGLARDTDEAMPADTRAYVQENWRAVQERTGASFNWDFWTQCQPRRATYPACRAVLAAAEQNAGPAMFRRIQQAYYQQARNPSDQDTLIDLSAALGLDQPRFAGDLVSPHIEQRLQDDFILRRRLGASSFPSLILEVDGRPHWLVRGYDDVEIVLERLRAILR